MGQMQETPWLYKLPITLVVKICSYSLVKSNIYEDLSQFVLLNQPYGISKTRMIITIRKTCKLLCHLGQEKNWWGQISRYLDSSTCAFYCYKILDFYMSKENYVYRPIFEHISVYTVISKNLRPSVKISLLRFIAMHNYKFDGNTGIYFFQTLLRNNVNIQETTTEQLVKTLRILEDKQFYTYYINHIQEFATRRIDFGNSNFITKHVYT